MPVTSTTFLPVLVPVEDDRYLDEWVLDEFLDDLAVGYSVGPSFGQRLVSWGDLDRVGMSHRVVRRQAEARLDAGLDRVRFYGQPPALMLSFDGLESSVLLADAFWDSLEGSVPGELVVGVPARDVVIVTGSESRSGLEKVRRAVDRVFFAGGRDLLTERLLVRRRGEWMPWRPAAGAHAAPGSPAVAGSGTPGSPAVSRSEVPGSPAVTRTAGALAR